MLAWLAHAYLRHVHSQSIAADVRPARAQERTFGRLRAHLCGTRAAQVQDPRAFGSLEQFRRFARATTYTDYQPIVHEARKRGSASAGFFEKRATTTFAHSSTNQALIPFTGAQIADFRAFQAEILGHALVTRGVKGVLRERTLILQGSWEIERTSTGLLGYSSAVMMEASSALLKRKLLPSIAVLREPNIERRVSATRDALISARPTQLSGMPAHVTGMIRHMFDLPHADEVRDALSRIRFYLWGGAELGPNEAFLRSVLAADCVFVDALSASEGAMGLPAEECGVFRPALGRSVLLFESVDSSEKFFAWELDLGAEYNVLVSGLSGLTAYRTGDRIRVSSQNPLRFRLVSREREGTEIWNALRGEGSDFFAYVTPDASHATLLVEAARGLSPHTKETVRKALGASELSVTAVEPGLLAKVAVLAQTNGWIKLPRVLKQRDAFEAVLRLSRASTHLSPIANQKEEAA